MLKKLAVDALKMLFLHPVALVWNTIKVIIVFLLLSTGVESLCNITLPYMQSLRQCFTWYSPELKELTISSSDSTKETKEPSALSLTKSFTLPGSHVANEFKSPVNHELYQLSNLVATHPEIYQDPLMRDLFKIQAAQLYFNSQYYPQNANANLDLAQSLPEVYDLPKLPHSLPEAPLTTHDSADKYLEQANVLNSATSNLQNLSVLDSLINGSPLAKSTPQPNTALTPKLNEVAIMIAKQKREGDNAHVSLNHHKQAHYLAARPVEEEEEEEEEEELTTPNKSEEHIISLRELEDENSLEHLRSLEGSALCDFDKKPWSYLDLELEDPLENLSATDLAKFDQVQEALDLLYEHFGALDSHDLELVFTLYAPEKVLLTLERNEIRTQLLARCRNCPNPNTDSTKLVAPQLQLSSQPPSLATKTVSTKPPEHAPSVDHNPPHGLKNSLETKGATITTSNSHYVAASSSAKQSSIPHSTLAAPTNSLEHLRATTNTSSAPAREQEQNHIQTYLPKPQINIVLHSPELFNTSSALNNKDPSTTTTLAPISQVLSAAQQFMQGLSDLSALASLTELTPSTNNHNTISEHDVRALTTDSSALKDSSLTTSAPLTPGLPIAPAPGQEKLDLSTLSTATNQQLALSTAAACTLSSTKDHAPNLFVIPNTKISMPTSAAPLNATSSQLVFHTLPPSSGGPLNDKVLIATLPNYEDNSLLRPTYIEEEEEEEEELVNSTPTTVLVAANKTKSQCLDKASTSKVNTNNESLMPTQILESMNNLASYHASTRAHASNWQSTSKEISKNGTSISAPEILERKSTLTNCSLSSPDLANTQYLSSNNAREPQMPTVEPSPMNLSNNKDNIIHAQLDSVSAAPAQVAQDLYKYFVALQDHQLMNKPLGQVRQNALYLTALINAPEDLLPHCPGQKLNASELKDQAYRQALIYRRFLEQTLSQRAQLLSKTNVQLPPSNHPTKHLPHKPLILSSSNSIPDTPVAAQLPSGATTVDSAHELAPTLAINNNTSMPNTPVAAQSALVSNDSTTLVSLPTNLEGLRLGEQRPLSLGNLNLSANTSLSDQELLGRPFFKSEDLDLALRQALHLPKEQATTSLLRSLGISDNASQGSQFSSTNESKLDNYQEQLKTLAQGLTYNEQALKQDQERALHMLMTNSALLQERQLISSDLLSQLQSSLETLDLVPLAIITEIVAHAHHLGDYSPEQQEQLTVLANFVLNSPSHQRHNYLSLAMLKRYQQICLSYGFKAIYHQAPLLFYQAASLQAV